MQADDRPPQEKTPRSRARRFWRALLVVGGGCLAAFIVLVGVAAYNLYQLPLSSDFREPKRPALTLLAGDGTPFAVRGASQGREVALDDLPPYLVDAVIAMEDRRFFEHGGVDLRGLLRAAYANLTAGRTVQGGSTITQQLVRAEFLSADKTFTRKIQEALLALWLERRLSKEEILTRYLNSIYLGAGAYGVDAASRRYFGKPVEEIGLAEAALLAGLIPAPSRFAPNTSPEAAAKRATLVLDTMVKRGKLSAEAADEAKAKPAALAVRPAEEEGFGYVADWVTAEARGRLAGVEGDFRVSTTIDPALQGLATATVERWLQAEGADAKASQAALVALAADGSVRAMVGGADYTASQFNRAVQARRQPGSAFKLFVYLAALEAGFDPESRIDDLPVQIGDWSPENYDGRYHGQTTLRQAFAKSYNAAAVRLQEAVGRERIIAQARALGIRSPLDANPSLALGTSEVTLLELTAAYASVRAGYRPVAPFVLTRIESLGAARIGLDRRQATAPLRAGDEMRALLREVVATGTGRAAALPVASYGKTGTSQDNRDAWFIGFAGDLVVGVWVGNDDGSPMNGVTGGRLPARIWRDFMGEALRLEPKEPLVARSDAAEPPSMSGPGPAATPEFPAGTMPKRVVPPSAEDSAAPGPLADPDLNSPDEQAARETLVGIPSVLDTATLRIGRQLVRLEGVDGMSGAAARDMAEYIGGREVACRPTTGLRYRCEVDGWDLSEVVIFNGGGRASARASADLVEAEMSARNAGRGLWAR